MIKYAAVLAIITCIITACGTGAKEETVFTQENAVLGLELIENNDCQICHHVKNKINGPAYFDVASKYEETTENLDLLKARILQGSSGVWGDIAMPPHANLGEEDAQKMVIYILSLNEE